MNILISGGTGFIGSYLAKELISNKHQVFILKRKGSDESRIKEIKKHLKTLNFNSYTELEKIFKNKRFDVIIHLATIYFKQTDSWKDNNLMCDTNISYPSILLQLAIKNNVTAFINTGTCFEYKLQNKPLNENDKISPYNFYTATKIAFEDLLKFYVDSKKIKALSLKLVYTYGEKDHHKVIPLMINSVLEYKKLELTLGEQQLGFTYVADIVDAYIKSIAFINSKKYKKYEVFNIGNNKLTKLKEIGRILEKISGRKNIFSFTKPYPENEIMYMSCDYSKAKRLLNWEPKTSIIDGLTKTYNYHLKNASRSKS